MPLSQTWPLRLVRPFLCSIAYPICFPQMAFIRWPEPGYVVGHPASVGSGHVGIVDFDGEGVAAGRTEVNRRCDWFLDGTSGFSVYVGTGGGSHDE